MGRSEIKSYLGNCRKDIDTGKFQIRALVLTFWLKLFVGNISTVSYLDLFVFDLEIIQHAEASIKNLSNLMDAHKLYWFRLSNEYPTLLGTDVLKSAIDIDNGNGK